jgi:hypothetical protein
MVAMGDILLQLPVLVAESVPGETLFTGGQGNLMPLAALGWDGLLDLRSIGEELGVLLLAAVLGAIIGFHPASKHTVDNLDEAELAPVFVMYAVIGAVIGVAVRQYGTVVGFVVFGIGGLLRFRSATDSTRDTVRLITVTLVGLIAGLGLLHFALLTTLFAFALIYIFDSSPAYRIRIEGLPMDRAADCATAYRDKLKFHRCRIIAERRSLEKKRIEFVFRLPRRGTRDQLELALGGIAADLRGHVDWEVN